jgi:glucose-fructose oxidoreductase
LAHQNRVRYAVVGLGYIAQAAVLPAFFHARENSQLVALVSSDREKLRDLSKRYRVPNTYSYEQYEECLRSGQIDAVFIALPNSMHREYSERAARAGIHVLCEKPMAVTEEDCVAMIEAARQNRVKLMIAYRLHFEEANLRAIDIVQSGKIGEPRVFNSTFTMQVKPGNIRLQREKGGGTLYDIGIYCINAARYLFQAEPTEVVAVKAAGREPRFAEVEEGLSAILKFPGERLAAFTCSFGAADVAAYEVVGTKGSVRLDPAYEYATQLKQRLKIEGKEKIKVFRKRDQFAPELVYFSDCVLHDREPEPSGEEGLADVRIIQAVYRSADTRTPVNIEAQPRKKRPSREQEISRPAVSMPKLVNASGPSPE